MASDWSSIHDHDPVLHQMAYMGDVGKIQQLLKSRSQLSQVNVENRLGCTPLRLAATAGHADCVKYLIEQGATVNAADVKAQTPLFVAVKNKHRECIEILLRAGANPNGNPNSLCTPLYIAAMEGFLEGIQELVKYDVELNSCQMMGGSFISTPLYITVAYHHFLCFRALLCAGADANFGCKVPPDKDPSTKSKQSLFHAIVRHNVETEYAHLLYEFGANIYFCNDKGLRPYELDVKNECVDYIKELAGMPQTLASLCRILIRTCIAPSRLHKMSSLPLPSRLVRYLQHQEQRIEL